MQGVATAGLLLQVLPAAAGIAPSAGNAAYPLAALPAMQHICSSYKDTSCCKKTPSQPQQPAHAHSRLEHDHPARAVLLDEPLQLDVGRELARAQVQPQPVHQVCGKRGSGLQET